MPAELLIKNRYEIRSVLGRGGMGIVYRAYDTVMRREVALKTLRDVPDSVFIDLFYRESTVLAGMVHPNVVEVFDIGEFEEGGVSKPYFVMPLLPGQTLHDVLYPAAMPLSVIRGVDIISQCCRGLQAAHTRGLLHRDIKPRNIFVMRDDAVKVIDFGVAHMMGNHSTGLRGTPQYMSPEQITFKPLSNRSDIFSLAVVAYEILTASHPFLRDPGRQDSEVDVATAITSYNPPLIVDLNPGVSRSVSLAIAKAMMKDPRARFESAAAFADALQRALRNEGDTVQNIDGVRTRLERARQSFQKKELQFASEIVNQLEAEGHSDAEIGTLRRNIDEAIQRDRTERLLQAALQYFESEEYTLALKKVHELLEIAPKHADALALSARVETVLTEQKVTELLAAAKEHLERLAFTNARQAAQDALKLRPHDTRAREVLSLVDGKQKELLRQRQEQERLFQSAQAAWLEGKIEAALAELEGLAELTRRSNDNRERVTEYKDFYRRVRNELDELTASVDQARYLLSGGNAGASQQIYDRHVAKYPDHPLIQALGRDITQLRQQEEANFLTNIRQSLETVPQVEKRLQILESGLKVYPSNTFIQEEIQRVRSLQQTVERLANEARSLERQRQFDGAVERWHALRELYFAYPGIDEAIARAEAEQRQQRSQRKAALVAEITAALEAENYTAADHSLASAESHFPADDEFTNLKFRRVRDASLSEEALRLIEEVNRSSRARPSDAAAALVKAAEASRGLKATAEKVSVAALKHAKAIVQQDWRAADLILNEVFGSEQARKVAPQIEREIQKQRHAEEIRNTLNAIAKDRESGALAEAKTRAYKAAQLYPGERLIQEALKSVEAELVELRRSEDRQKCLAELARSRAEFENSTPPVDARRIDERVKALAAPLQGDAEVDQACSDLARQISRAEQANIAMRRNAFAECRAICDDMLKNVPHHRLFLALKEEADEREGQERAEYLVQVERRLAAEPILETRADILTAALRRYPDEAYFKEELTLITNKQKLVAAVANRARTLERGGSVSEALEQWKYLETVYPSYPGLAELISVCTRSLDEQRGARRRSLVEDVKKTLEKRLYVEALERLHKAQQEFPGDRDLVELQHFATERHRALEAAERILNEARGAFDIHDIIGGFEGAKNALQTGGDEPSIRIAVAKILLDRARDALHVDVALCEMMIAEAAAADPQQAVSQELDTALRKAQEQQAFERYVSSVEELERSGNLTGALRETRLFLSQFPGHAKALAIESRISTEIETLEKEAARRNALAALDKILQDAASLVDPAALQGLQRAANKLAVQCSDDLKVKEAAGRTQSILAALTEIRRLLAAGEFGTAWTISTKALEQHPEYAKFGELLTESEFRRQDAAAEYLRHVERNLAAESNFARQAEILREALKHHPEEPYYRDELQLVESKRAVLDSAVARARELESRGKYEEAKSRWSELGKLYPWFSTAASEIERITRLLAQRRGEDRDARIVRIQQLLEAEKYESAQHELDAALADFSGDEKLGQITTQLDLLRERQALAMAALQQGEELLGAGQIEKGCECMRDAYQRSSQEGQLRERVFNSLLGAAQEQASLNWRHANFLLQEIAKLFPGKVIPARFAKQIQANRHEEEIRAFVDQVGVSEAKGNWDETFRLVELRRDQFSGDTRFEDVRKRINEVRRQIDFDRNRAEALEAIASVQATVERAIRKRQIAHLRSTLGKNGWLTSEDEQIRFAAVKVAERLDQRAAEIASARSSRLPRSYILPLAALIVLVIAGLAYLFVFRTQPVPVELGAMPAGISVTVGQYSCETPNCALKLPPGHYEAHFAKDGYDPAMVPLDIDGRKRPIRLAATLTAAQPLIRIAGNLTDGSVSLDGSKLGELRQGSFEIPSVKPGQHVLAVSEKDGNASIPFNVGGNRQFALASSPAAQALTVIALTQSNDSAELASVSPSHTPLTISVDGTPVGTKLDQVVVLPKLESGQRKLRVSDGSEAQEFNLSISAKSGLELFVMGKANTGTLLVNTNVSDVNLLVDNKLYGTIGTGVQLRAILPAGAHTVQATKDGYSPSQAVQVSLARGSEKSVQLQLTAQQGWLEITGAAPGTAIQVDHAPVGSIGKEARVFKRAIPSGDHVIELSKAGFLPRELQRHFKPGEAVRLAGSDLELAPATTSEVTLESKDWERASSSNSISALQAFLERHARGPHAALAEQQLTSLEWSAVQKNSASALQDFVTKNPQSPYSDQAKKLLGGLEEQDKIQAENADWTGTDKAKVDALRAFVSKHPSGAHSQTAEQLMRQLSKPKTPDQTEVEETAWNTTDPNNRASLESFLARFPAGKHRSEADTALAALTKTQQQTTEATGIIAALNSFANAWTAKDIDAIIAIEPGLSKRDLRDKLSGVRTLQMSITPLASPSITGDHGSLLCQRMVTQTFSDGSVRQTPSRVTFLLGKRSGKWVIESVQ